VTLCFIRNVVKRGELVTLLFQIAENKQLLESASDVAKVS